MTELGGYFAAASSDDEDAELSTSRLSLSRAGPPMPRTLPPPAPAPLRRRTGAFGPVAFPATRDVLWARSGVGVFRASWIWRSGG